MTPLEGETAVIALSVCAVAPWVLFGARTWRVSTSARPKVPPQDKGAPGESEAPAAAGLPPVGATLTEPLRRSA